MNKVKEVSLKAKTFLDEVVVEARKTTWPSREELIQSTVVVIVSVVLLAVVVGVSDKILVELLKYFVFKG